MGRLKSAVYAQMEDMSFRSGAAVAGAALAVVGAVIALAVMLTGHSAAATGTSPDVAARLSSPASSAPAPATSAVPSTTPRPRQSKVPPDSGRDLPAGPAQPPHDDGPACLGARPVTFCSPDHPMADAAEMGAE